MKHIVSAIFLFLFLCSFTAAPLKRESIAKSPIRDSVKAMRLYTSALKDFTIYNDTIGANKKLELALSADSTCSPALFLLARIAKGNKDMVDYATRAYHCDTTNRHYLSFYGEALARSGRYEEAIAPYKLLTKISNDPDNFRILAVLQRSLGRPLEAVATIDSAEVKVGRTPYLLQFRQNLLLSAHQYTRAVECAKRNVEEYPYLADSHVDMADAYLAVGNDSLAILSYQNALKVDSLSTRALISAGDYYYAHKLMPEYFATLNRINHLKNIPLQSKLGVLKPMIENPKQHREYLLWLHTMLVDLMTIYPNSKELTDLYAKHLIRSGQLEELSKYYRSIADKEGATYQAYADVLGLEKYLGHKEILAQYLGKATTLFSDNFDLWINRAALAYEDKDYDNSLLYASSAFAVAKNNIEKSNYYEFISEIYNKQNRRKECYRALEKAINLNKDNYSALNNYAYFLSEEGLKLDRALQMAIRANELKPNNATSLDTLAWIYYKLGNYKEAKKYMQQALSFNNDKDAVLPLHYGDILFALGEKFMAQSYWRKALERGADKDQIEERIKQSLQK